MLKWNGKCKRFAENFIKRSWQRSARYEDLTNSVLSNYVQRNTNIHGLFIANLHYEEHKTQTEILIIYNDTI